MLKKILITLTLLFALPAFANAWYVNAKASGSGTITPAGNQSYAAGVDSIEYSVAASQGNTLSRVTLDGVTLAANVNGKYVAPYSASKSWRYLVAYFAPTKLSITATVAGGNGAIREDTYESLTNISAGSSRQLLILPNPGCSIATLSAPNATSNLPNADGKSRTVTYNNLQASQTVTATFSLDPVVTANAGNDVTAPGTGAGLAATLFGSATSNQGDITYAWTGAGLSFGTPAAAITTVSAAAEGVYTATLTVTSNGIVKSDTATVTVLNRTAYLEGLCTSCHNGSTPTIVADYDSSLHKTNPYDAVVCQTCHDPSLTSGHYTSAQPTAVCQGCHANYPPAPNFAKSSHATTTHFPGGITCASCHNAHSTVATYGAGTATGCQTCHKPGSAYGIYSSNLAGKAPHFQAGTPDANGFYATASFIQPTASVSATCADCHGHNNTINAGWAEGGHGSLTAVPWKSDSGHTWLEQGGTQNFQSSPQSSNCIRCHSAQGFKQFVDSNFTKVSKIQNGGAPIKDSSPLTCNGCHTSPEGALNTANFGTTGYKAYWGYSTALISGKKVVTSIQLGDNRNSNICMPCHSQRASGQEIKDVFATGAFKQYSAGSAIYPHAAQPAAIFYGKGGYEFTTEKVSGDNGFAYQDRARHQRIGNNGTTGTGYNNTGITQGSCVACHMASAKTHSLEITSASFTNTCYKCHPSNFVQADVDAAKANFDAAVKALGNLLVAKGITLDGINPLPERKAKDMSLGAKDNVVAQRNMGAWFNWYLFSISDKGAYAHNPSYARRLITDSIDALDDGVLNNSAAATIKAQEVAGKLTGIEGPAAGKFSQDPGCLGCHFGNATNDLNGEAIPGVEKAPHYNTTGALVPDQTFTQAQFVVAGAQCNNCHGYGHGTDSPGYSVLNTAGKALYPNVSSGRILKNYAESAHGEINGLAWTDYNFLNLSSRSGCTPCHTTQGFVNAIASANANGGKVATPAFIGNAADTTKQVLGCNACHSSTAWKTSVRTISGGYVAAMGGFSLTAPAYITYPDVGESNVCTPCHASRENGDSINASTANFGSTSFKNPHYLAASAVFYGKGGFQFYTSGVRYNTYGAAGKVGRNANWSHGKLGMDNYTTSALTTGINVGTSKDNAGKVRGSGSKGQCVACHLGPTNTHTFGAYEVAKATWGTNATNAKGCFGCHSGEDMEEVAVGEKALVDRSLDFLAYQLEAYGLYFNNDKNPYFFTDATFATSATNWLNDPYGVVATGKQTMGAAQNLKLLKAEKGSHVHNRAFMRALITDSVVYLQKGPAGIAADRRITDTNPNNLMNFTNYSTAISAPNSDRIAAGQSGSTVSINALKGYLIRNNARR